MEQWILIESETECSVIWDKFYSLFNFTPDYREKVKCPFDFSKVEEPVAYDISGISITNFEAYDANGNYRMTEQIAILKSVFIECMSEDEFIYALDWQHCIFKYNPRIEAAYGYYMAYLTSPDTRAYFPDFHPNGDYFFFIAKDFSWGYLTHPWQRKVWFYGSKIVDLIKNQENKLGFISCVV